ncbi:hypothetical protein CA85_13800 [Allorhodopirellula solitaria]|uniref:Uncharacterized protein n=1 Tax=Allorhodopirellula solitaria TaxID=2527987 RepID=A0A5C5YDA5_9BACT|nr:hypothetical protein CA85_13800 [Allorhodopirellula solitaria]
METACRFFLCLNRRAGSHRPHAPADRLLQAADDIKAFTMRRPVHAQAAAGRNRPDGLPIVGPVPTGHMRPQIDSFKPTTTARRSTSVGRFTPKRRPVGTGPTDYQS